MADQAAVQASPHIWSDIYRTWDDACEAAKAIGGAGLSGDTWLQRITLQLSEYGDELDRYGIAMPPRPCNLPLVCAMASPARIVDLGGSSGWSWHYLRNTWREHTVSSYVVVETPEVVGHMRKVRPAEPPVSYVSLNDPIEACDVLYCNSVLQYFGGNAPVLSLLERARPRYVLLDDLVARGEEDFFSVQSFRGSGIPYRFLGLGKLLRELSHAGYAELARLPYASPVHGVIKPLDMGNLPPANQLRYSISLLLKTHESQ